MTLTYICITLFVIPFIFGMHTWKKSGSKQLGSNSMRLVILYLLFLIGLWFVIYHGSSSPAKGTPEGRANMTVFLFALPSLIFLLFSYALYPAIKDWRGLHWFWRCSVVLGGLLLGWLIFQTV